MESAAAARSWKREASTRSLAHGVPLLVGLGGILAAISILRGYFDPDTFWHLATGRFILETGAIPTTDPFSFTWFGEPWIPDQWLADVVLSGGIELLGDAAVLGVMGVVAALGPTFVFTAAPQTAGRRGVLDVATVVAVTATLLPQVTARPQVFSFAFAGVLLWLLLTAGPAHRGRLWFIPLLMLVWANTHGFFVVGLGIVAVYAAATLAGATRMRDDRGLVVAVGALSLVAAAVTPQGPAGVLYAVSFLDTSDLGTREIAEWQSPDFHNLQFLPFLGLIVLALGAGIHRAPRWTIVLAIVGVAAGLFAIRATGIAAILVMPAILLVGSPPVTRDDGRGETVRRILELMAATMVAAILIGASLARGPITVDPRRAPVEGVALLRSSDPDARVLAEYAWGGYVIDQLYDRGGRVFVDGRMHKYAPAVLADYLAIIDAEDGWRSLVEEYGVEAILLPPYANLVQGPAQDAGWCELFRDEREVLLRRCDV